MAKLYNISIILILLRLRPGFAQRLPRLDMLPREAEIAAIDEEGQDPGDILDLARAARGMVLRRDGPSLWTAEHAQTPLSRGCGWR
jgi:hypothetical protein